MLKNSRFSIFHYGKLEKLRGKNKKNTKICLLICKRNLSGVSLTHIKEQKIAAPEVINHAKGTILIYKGLTSCTECQKSSTNDQRQSRMNFCYGSR